MITSRLLVWGLAIALVALQGCSSEEDHPNDNSANAVNTQHEINSNGQAQSNASEVSAEQTSQLPQPPSRSELRVMSEEAKATEEQAKGVIEQFDMNLNDREQRKLAEAKFKNMLPEYKEKMLQLGKAQLQEQK